MAAADDGGEPIGVISPPIVHFCWIGTTLPWAYAFAILSAARRGDLADVVLHHTDELEDGEAVRALRGAAGVMLHRLDAHAELARVGAALGIGDALCALYQRLESPVMRCDILRAALLYQQGGIYLDLDTVTVASLHPLLQAEQFVGSEYIVWPRSVRASRSPLIGARHLGLDLLRKALRWLPWGWRAFRLVESCYVRGVNNAIMGGRPGAPLFAAYLRSMPDVPLAPPVSAYVLGPHLLEDVIARLPAGSVTIQPPHVFSPLPPEISEHWFRTGRRTRFDSVLFADTRVVHWYASVRTKSNVGAISPAYVLNHRTDQFYSMLICACLPDLVPAP